MPPRGLLVVLLFLTTACGGGAPRANVADLVAQPTPDPTLDAVVRGLPRMLAGVPATPTPTAIPPRPTLKPAKATAPPTPKPRR
jgi:hypothetical protein